MHMISSSQPFWRIHSEGQELWLQLCPELEFFSLDHGVFRSDSATFDLSLGERSCLPFVHGLSSHTGAALTSSRKEGGGPHVFLSECIPLTSPSCANARLFATAFASQRNKPHLRTSFSVAPAPSSLVQLCWVSLDPECRGLLAASSDGPMRRARCACYGFALHHLQLQCNSSNLKRDQ